MWMRMRKVSLSAAVLLAIGAASACNGGDERGAADAGPDGAAYGGAGGGVRDGGAGGGVRDGGSSGGATSNGGAVGSGGRSSGGSVSSGGRSRDGAVGSNGGVVASGGSGGVGQTSNGGSVHSGGRMGNAEAGPPPDAEADTGAGGATKDAGDGASDRGPDLDAGPSPYPACNAHQAEDQLVTSEPHGPPHLYGSNLQSDVFPVGVYRVSYVSSDYAINNNVGTCSNVSGQATITIGIDVTASPSCAGDACLTGGQLVVTATTPNVVDYAYLSVDGEITDPLVLKGSADEDARVAWDFELHIGRHDGSLVAFWSRVESDPPDHLTYAAYYGTGALDCPEGRLAGPAATIPYAFCYEFSTCPPPNTGLPPCAPPPPPPGN
jgi:hypothetical protein